ncbi:hypothetical protein DFH09DRAFT_1300017 [Mycena vulgaris]|nr:hypothetical protein DFH09DRAFT_1300017 [Mycena vulgaris]
MRLELLIALCRGAIDEASKVWTTSTTMQDRTAATTVPRSRSLPLWRVARPHARIQKLRRDAWETLGLTRRALAFALAPAREGQCELVAGAMSPVVVQDVRRILLDDGSFRGLWKRAGLRVMQPAAHSFTAPYYSCPHSLAFTPSPLLPSFLPFVACSQPTLPRPVRIPLSRHAMILYIPRCDDLETAALPPPLPSSSDHSHSLPALSAALPPFFSRSRSRSQGASGTRSLHSLRTTLAHAFSTSPQSALPSHATRPPAPEAQVALALLPFRPADVPHPPPSIFLHPVLRPRPSLLYPLARASHPAHPVLCFCTSASPGPARAGPSPPSLSSLHSPRCGCPSPPSPLAPLYSVLLHSVPRPLPSCTFILAHRSPSFHPCAPALRAPHSVPLPLHSPHCTARPLPSFLHSHAHAFPSFPSLTHLPRFCGDTSGSVLELSDLP